MQDTSALAGLLDRAANVFGLANTLGQEFEQEFRNRPAVNLSLEQQKALKHQYREKINEFIAAVSDLRHVIVNPPDLFVSVARQLRVAGIIAKQLRDSHPGDASSGDIFELFPELNQVAFDGYQSVKEARKELPSADPLVFLEKSPIAEQNQEFTLVDRYPTTTAGHIAFLEFVHNEVHYAADAKRNQLAEKYSNATIESMVSGILWVEARQRVVVLSELPSDIIGRVARVLRRELTLSTVERIDEMLGPAVRSLRDTWEDRDLSPPDQADGQDFIARLLVGPDDVELKPRELALLDAHLKQPISLAQMQSETREETNEKAIARNKLKLICDFNRNLHAATGSVAQPAQPLAEDPSAPTATDTPRKRGRRKASDATIQREAQLAANWERARDSGTHKVDFAKENGMNVKQLDALLDRVRARKRLSE